MFKKMGKFRRDLNKLTDGLFDHNLSFPTVEGMGKLKACIELDEKGSKIFVLGSVFGWIASSNLDYGLQVFPVKPYLIEDESYVRELAKIVKTSFEHERRNRERKDSSEE